jgi:tetratricopeptide (TPR) repeat protein
MRRARKLDPLNPLSYALSSQVAFQARDYAGALQHADRAIVVDREFWIGHQMRGQALEELGDHDLALKALATAARLSGQNSKPISLTGYILGRSGRTAEARDLLGALEMASRQRVRPAVCARPRACGARRCGRRLRMAGSRLRRARRAPDVPHGRRQVGSVSH